jgi:UDP-N-acetylglucosamine--N-acetylmuramyl-(pentapeptide) pyrophosphoryl-undecaprenol N-acetylglucosamine transferase
VTAAAQASGRGDRVPARRRVLVLADAAHSGFLDRHAPELLAAVATRVPVAVRHQTEVGAIEAVRERYGGLDAVVTGYLDDAIGPAYAAADFVICRAGAGSLAEVAACGRPALLVPLRGASEGHQDRNAAAHGASGAALVAPESVWDGDRLATAVAALLADTAAWSAMSAAARARATPGAAEALLDDLGLAYGLSMRAR